MGRVSLRQRLGGFLVRQLVSDPNHWLTNILVKTSPSSSGQTVDSDSSLKVSTVYACVKVIADAMASLPLMLYRRVGDGGKEPATNHPLFSIMHDAPNGNLTSFEFREVELAHILLRGNFYGLKVESPSGKLLEIIPLSPARMTPEQKDGAIIYNYLYEDGKKVAFPAEKIWHVKNMPISASYSGSMPEGIVGLSPISIAQEAVGIAMAADQYGGRYFANNAAVGMGLQYPDHIKLSPEAKNYLSEKLTEYSKTENKFKSIILDQGGKLEKIGMSNEDSQFLESRNFQVEEIARIYRVPPVLIGHPTNTMTYASAEQLFLSFATYTIRPWCVRLEQSMNRYLLPERERGKYFFEFKMDGLLRGDYAARMNGYAVARNWGLMNVDEIRALENMNPLPSGKGAIYLQPLNMVEAGTPPLAPTKLAEPTAQEGDKNNG